MKNKLWDLALILAIITVVYNILEGLISVYFGIEDETLTLFGFGIDSFIEVLSGSGILYLVIRVRKGRSEEKYNFEKIALKITGIAFYILSLGLMFTGVLNIINRHKPETTLAGIIISIISILTMSILIKAKLYVGRSLNSDAIVADAHCTRICLVLSFILLVSSLLYEIIKIGYIDSLGAIGIAYFSFKEGRESFEKAEKQGCLDEVCPR